MKKHISLALFISLTTACSSTPLTPWETPPENKLVRQKAARALGTRFVLRLWLDPKDKRSPDALLKVGLAEVFRIARLADADDPKSELSRVNQIAATAPVTVSPDLAAMLSTGQQLHQRTGGVFDVSFAPIQDHVESFGPDAGFDGGDREHAAPNVDAQVKQAVGQHWSLDPGQRKVQFSRPGVKLVVKGVAKGYIAQKVAEKLAALKVRGGAVIAETSFVAWGAALSDPQLMCVEDFSHAGRCSYRLQASKPDRFFAFAMAATIDRPGHNYNPKDGSRTFAANGAAVAGPDGAWAQGAATAASILTEDKFAVLFSKSAQPPLGALWESADAKPQGSLDPYAHSNPIKD